MKVARTMKSQAGFSLIELMIVVAIIGILASIAVPNFQKFQRKAKQTEGKGYLAAIYSGEKSFQAEWNSYSSCVGAIGFTPEGKGVYRAGFGAAGIDAVPGSTAIAGCATSAPAPVAAAGATIPAALTAADTTTAIAFTAEARGELYPGAAAANIDYWTIDELKAVTNTQSGL